MTNRGYSDGGEIEWSGMEMKQEGLLYFLNGLIEPLGENF